MFLLMMGIPDEAGDCCKLISRHFIVCFVAVVVVFTLIVGPLKRGDQGADHFCHFHQLASRLIFLSIREQFQVVKNTCVNQAFPYCAFGHLQIVYELAFVPCRAFGDVQHDVL